jgi:hypothetical protein
VYALFLDEKACIFLAEFFVQGLCATKWDEKSKGDYGLTIFEVNRFIEFLVEDDYL